MTLPPLHTESYRYAEAAAELGRLDTLYFPQRDATLDAIRIQQGGKGVGLELCKEIAKLSPRLVVPEFFSIPPEGTPDDRWQRVVNIVDANPTVHSWVLRSSNYDEDWIDPRCGVQQSVRFNYYERFTSKSRIERLFEEGGCHVLQHHVQGIGHVVDLAYSPIFDRSVVHVASGRFYHMTGQCSSATNDLEASHAIFDLKSGVQLFPDPRHQFSWVGESAAEVAHLFREISGGLPDFGHQLEVIAGPKVKPETPIALVQVRPSPSCVRTSALPNFPRETPVLYLNPAAWSGAVTGPCEIVFGKTQDYLSDTSPFAETCKEQFYSRFEQSADTPDLPLRGKILVWQDLSYHISERLTILVGAALQGAAAQIVEGACFTNSNHDGFLPLDRYTRPSYDNVVQRCLFVGAPSGAFRLFQNQLDTARPVSLFCDGFATAVFQSDVPA